MASRGPRRSNANDDLRHVHVRTGVGMVHRCRKAIYAH